MFSTTLRGAALAGILLLIAPGLVQAGTTKVTAQLKAGSETPPNDSRGSGLLVGTYDAASKKLTWDVHFQGLTGPATTAHFHGPAPVGKPAGILIPIPSPVTSPIKGEATLTDEQAKEMTDGLVYFNVHTQKNPKGEIRGQVMLEK